MPVTMPVTLGGHLDHVAAHLSVASPGVIDVLIEGLVGIPGDGGYQCQVDDAKTEFFNEFHLLGLLNLYPEGVHQQDIKRHQRQKSGGWEHDIPAHAYFVQYNGTYPGAQ
jgi:hypothetical protein